MKRSKFSWKKLFGSKKDDGNAIPGIDANVTECPKGTLERLREMEDLLQRKQTFLETRIDALIAEARKHGTKNKRAALLALKRKKRLETELLRIDGILSTIELQREALESAKTNVQVLGALREAANFLKNAQKHVTADKVLDIMDAVNEQQEVANEIADAMSNPIGGMNSMVDETELERELEELEQEELDKALLQVNYSASILTDETSPPEEKQKLKASTHSKKEAEKPIVVDEDEKELQELAAWSQ